MKWEGYAAYLPGGVVELSHVTGLIGDVWKVLVQMM